jgi:hypothetical protein
MKEAPQDYIDALTRKSKNLLIRVALLFDIRHRNKPGPDMYMPKLSGTPPADWWGPGQDRDLLIGICIHGYQQ